LTNTFLFVREMIKHMRQILFSILVFVTTLSSAQTKGHITLSLGPSIATGDFGTSSISNASAGFAGNGLVFDLSASYLLGKRLGIIGLIHSQANSFNNQAFVNYMAYNTSVDWSMTSKSWSVGSYMIGGFADFEVKERFHFQPRFLIGYAIGSSPELELTLVGSGGADWIKQSSVYGSNFALMFGGGFQYYLSDKVTFIADMDYFSTTIDFLDIKVTSSIGGAPYIQNTKQPITAVNLTFGLGVRI